MLYSLRELKRNFSKNKNLILLFFINFLHIFMRSIDFEATTAKSNILFLERFLKIS